MLKRILNRPPFMKKDLKDLKDGACSFFSTWEGCDRLNHVVCPSF